MVDDADVLGVCRNLFWARGLQNRPSPLVRKPNTGGNKNSKGESMKGFYVWPEAAPIGTFVSLEKDNWRTLELSFIWIPEMQLRTSPADPSRLGWKLPKVSSWGDDDFLSNPPKKGYRWTKREIDVPDEITAAARAVLDGQKALASKWRILEHLATRNS